MTPTALTTEQKRAFDQMIDDTFAGQDVASLKRRVTTLEAAARWEAIARVAARELR